MKVFLVDDDHAVLAQLTETLPPAGIELQVATDVQSAINLFKSGSFDVVLLDLDLRGNEYQGSSRRQGTGYAGIHLGARLRAKDVDILVVMYSAAITFNNEKAFAHYQECIDAGAHYVVSLQWLTSAAPKNIAATLTQYRGELDKSLRELTVELRDDIETKALLEELEGEKTLRSLLRKTLPRMTHHEVQVVSGGYSGAHLLRVLSSNADEGITDVRNFVKLSRSAFPLERELLGKPYQGSTLDLRSSLPTQNEPVSTRGWNAVSIPEVRDATTLEDFVLSRSDNSANRTILKKVVSHLLVEPASRAMNIGSDTADTALRLRFSFISETLAALKLSRSYAQVYHKKGLRAVDTVEQYLRGLVDGYFILGAETKMVSRLHGDFHGRNVLVNANGECSLIDYGRADLYPRLADMANLDVDLLVRVLGSNDESCWNPKAIGSWWKLAEASFPLCSPQEPSGSCLLSLRYLTQLAVASKIENASKREYASVLLFHILRYLRFPTIPIPKKVLACRWAEGLLDKFSVVN